MISNKDTSRQNFGAAHLNPRDAYKDVPILKEPTWNHEVAAYFFFGGISAGSALIGSLAEVFGGARRRRLAHIAHYVSFAALLPCPPLLIDDLGRPGRFHHMLRVFKPSSPMNLGSWALVVHGAGATLTVITMLARDGKLPFLNSLLRLMPERLLAGLGIPSAMVLGGYGGVLLGTTSIPVWHTSPLLGALFIGSSLSTGTAAVSLISALGGREGRSDREALTRLGVLLDLSEVALLGGYAATSGASKNTLLGGQHGLLLKGATAALVTATLIEIKGSHVGRHKRLVSVLAAAATLAGGALLRWGVVRAGRASAADRETTLETMKPRQGSPGWQTEAAKPILALPRS